MNAIVSSASAGQGGIDSQGLIGASVKAANSRKLTLDGRRWLNLMVNPCGEKMPPRCGIPDGAATLTAIPEYAIEKVLSAPMFPTGVDTGNWAFINLPMAQVKCLVVFWVGSLDKNILVNNVAKLCTASVDVNDWISLTDGCSAMWVTQPLATTQNQGAASMRMTAQGMTITTSAPQLETQGFVYSYQAKAEMQTTTSNTYTLTEVTGTDNKAHSVVTSVTSHRVWDIRLPTLDTTALTETYPNGYKGSFEDGVYQVLYHNGQNFDFTSNFEWYPLQNYASSIIDAPMRGWNSGVTVFEGCSLNASFRLKMRFVYQRVEQPGAGSSPFTVQPALLDRTALDSAMILQNQLPHAYPAAYNDWGWLKNLLSAGVGMLPGGKFIQPIFDYVAPKVSNWVSNKVRDKMGNPVVSDGDIFYDARSRRKPTARPVIGIPNPIPRNARVLKR